MNALDAQIPANCGERKVDRNVAPVPLPRCQPTPSSVQFDQHYDQAPDRTSMHSCGRSVCLPESFEYVRKKIRTDTDAVSATLISMCELTRANRICTFPPLGVNLMALDRRFQYLLGDWDRKSSRPRVKIFSRRMPLTAAGFTVEAKLRWPTGSIG
jgi:hypothetical protein